MKPNCKDRQTGHKGGELALVSNGKLIELTLKKTFENGLWKNKAGNQGFSFLGVCHPSLSEINVHTNQQFVNELLDLFTEIMNKSNDMIVARDFNIHYLNKIDADKEQLGVTMESIGLKLHVTN